MTRSSFSIPIPQGKQVYIYGDGVVGVVLSTYLSIQQGVHVRGIIVSDGRRRNKMISLGNGLPLLPVYELSDVPSDIDDILVINTSWASEDELRISVERLFGKGCFVTLPYHDFLSMLRHNVSLIDKEHPRFSDDGRPRVIIPVMLHHISAARRQRPDPVMGWYPLFRRFTFSHRFPIIVEEYFTVHEDAIYANVQDHYRFRQYHNETERDEYILPASLYDELRASEGSDLAATLRLLTERYEPIETQLEEFINDISQHCQIDAFVVVADTYASLKHLADKHGIQIISIETAMRSDYLPNVYFCFDDVYSTSEIMQRYDLFTKEKSGISFPLLSREEILLIMLQDHSLKYLDDYSRSPAYKVGIAGDAPVLSHFLAKAFYTDFELVNDIRSNFSEDDIIFRRHPRDPYNADYNFKNKDDHSCGPIDFIQNCEKIAAIGSNIIFEAMLWNRPVYSRGGISMFSKFVEEDFSNKTPKVVDDDLINFVVFCIYVPSDVLFDVDYIMWRLSGPSEIEIFDRHLDIYLSVNGIERDVICLPRDQRIKRLKELRGISEKRV